MVNKSKETGIGITDAKLDILTYLLTVFDAEIYIEGCITVSCDREKKWGCCMSHKT